MTTTHIDLAARFMAAMLVRDQYAPYELAQMALQYVDALLDVAAKHAAQQTNPQ